jgi:hypothetical protein
VIETPAEGQNIFTFPTAPRFFVSFHVRTHKKANQHTRTTSYITQTTSSDTENTPNNTTIYGNNDGSKKTTVGGGKKKGISFGEVRIQEHEHIINHRPSARYANLTLGWVHHASERLLVDDFERIKEEEHHQKKKHRDHER